jgi:hypothetical protein
LGAVTGILLATLTRYLIVIAVSFPLATV